MPSWSSPPPRSNWLGLCVLALGAVVACSGVDFGPADDGTGGDPGAMGGLDGAANAGSVSGGSANGGASDGSGGIVGGTGGAVAATNGGASGEGGASAGASGTNPGGESASEGGRGGGFPFPRGGEGPGGGGGNASGGAPASGGSASGGSPSSSEMCSLYVPGATGDEPLGQIPVCCAPSADEKTDIEEVFTLLNEHRMANGRSALAYDDELEAAIQGHCLHMQQHSFFDHEAEEEGVVLPWDRAELCGTSANGENIARGQRSPSSVMNDWIESTGHNQNMLNSRFKRVGIGYVARGNHWGQLFGQ